MPFFSKAQQQLADSLVAVGKLTEASIAYEYAIYKEPELTKRVRLMVQRAYVQKNLGQFSNAFNNLQRADIYALSDSLAAIVLYESAFNAYMAEMFDQSLSKLVELETYSHINKRQASLIEILNLNALSRWDEAHQKFLKFCDMYGLTVEDPYADPKALKMKNPEKAFNLSYFLPGVGQMYAGYFWKGFLSGFINLAAVGFAGYSFYTGYYFSGAFTGVTLFYIFYNGGARYAEVLAEQYNEKKGEALRNKVKAALLK